jgi:hypothetical protein
MPVTFHKPDDDVVRLVGEVMQDHHPLLCEAGVRVGLIVAVSDKEGVSPLKSNGWPVYAKLKIVPLKDRLVKQYDVELLLDGGEWEGLGSRKQEALIDHELSKITLKNHGRLQGRVNPVTGEIEEGELWCDTDDLGRPKLTRRLGDWCVGEGFNAVVRRHGLSSLEMRALLQAQHTIDQESTTGRD